MCFHFPRLSFFSNAFLFFRAKSPLSWQKVLGAHQLDSFLFTYEDSKGQRGQSHTATRGQRARGPQQPLGAQPHFLRPSPALPLLLGSQVLPRLPLTICRLLQVVCQRNSFVLMSLRTPSTPSTSSTCLRGQGLPSGSRKGKPGSPWAL